MDAKNCQFNFTINEKIAEEWMDEAIIDIHLFLKKEFNLHVINYARYSIMESMCYQLGVTGFMGFKNMVAAIKAGDWNKAADEALDSKWARKDTPERAKRHAEVLRTGTLDVYDGLI